MTKRNENSPSSANRLPSGAGELLRLDGRDFIDRFSSADFARLYGHPAGYRGYGDGAGLLDSVQRGSFAVILVDDTAAEGK